MASTAPVATRTIRKAVLGVASLLPMLVQPDIATARGAPAEDAFLQGYASAIVERDFGLPRGSVSVRDGVVTVARGSLGPAEGGRLRGALAAIPGVRQVRIAAAAPPSPPPPVPAPASAAPEAAPGRSPGPGDATDAPARSQLGLLPGGLLFEPLVADPRWPRFSASYRYFNNDPDVTHAGSATFGETFSLYRGEGLGGRWEVGFQAGVFSIFDLASESADLINADYWVGIPVGYRLGSFSGQVRVYHQSSHLGDEYLLRRRPEPLRRVNVSFEAADALVSYDIGENWRVYGGGGYLFHRTPDDLKRWTVQGGAEFQGDPGWLGGALRPVGAVDLQSRQGIGWDPEVSLRAGVELVRPPVGRRIQVLAEYYNGRNPNGQFYERRLQYFGVGLHVYFN
ncbi:MAG TPA: DUF1207 domain-containing protein [Azospirillum sp.]|nr:DUF1207 domain-containing protein [Azospirillum sp.]